MSVKKVGMTAMVTIFLFSSAAYANVEGGLDSGVPSGVGSIAISSPNTLPANAVGDNTVVIGSGYAAGNGSVVIGNGNGTGTATNAVVIGYGSISATNDSVAIGHNATIFQGENSVALGSSSVASEDNVISVGDASSGFYRRITNVADPINDHDAVNKRYVDTSINSLRSEIGDLRSDMNRGIALSAALASSPSIDSGKDSAMSVSSGFYKGSSALALAYSRRVGSISLVGALSKSGGDTASRASVNFSW